MAGTHRESLRMKKFSRMPKSESGGLGGASGSGSSSGVSSYFGKVFAVGRYQVTVEELVAEGMYSSSALQCVQYFSGTHPSPPVWREKLTQTAVKQLSFFFIGW